MLEEALSDGNMSPSEAALALLSFLRHELQAGGTSAEARFIRLFPMLLARIFGALNPSSFEHEFGGWMSHQSRWSPRPPNNLNVSSSSGIGGSAKSSASMEEWFLATLRRAFFSAFGDADSAPKIFASVPFFSLSDTAAFDPMIDAETRLWLSSDPVIRLLSPGNPKRQSHQQPSLIDAMTLETERRPTVRFAFPFQALPKTTQSSILYLLGDLTATPGQQNVLRLLTSVLRNAVPDQTDLRFQLDKYHRESQKKQHQANTPAPLTPSSHPASLPFSSPSTPSSNPPTKPIPTPIKTPALKLPIPNHVPAPLMITMFEHFLLTFLRYPLANYATMLEQKQHSATTNLTSAFSSPYMTTWDPFAGMQSDSSSNKATPSTHQLPYGATTYIFLFQTYLHQYLPHLSTYLIMTPSPMLTPSSSQELQRNSEFFLRATLEFWMDGYYAPPPALLLPASFDTLANAASFSSLPKGYKFKPQPSLVRRCIHSLILHLTSDPYLQSRVAFFSAYDDHKSPNNKNSTMATTTTTTTTAASPSTPVSPLPGKSSPSWPLSQAMELTQRPFYDYVRRTLQNAPVNFPESPFFSALRSWLCWLEPWNAVMQYPLPSLGNLTVDKAKDYLLDSTWRSLTGRHTFRGGHLAMTTPAPSSQSMYNASVWEPYVAANLHMYAVPLAIFLKRARELDFSTREFRKSLCHVQRVLRVYTPELVDVIDNLLSNKIQDNVGHHSSNLAPLLARHERNLASSCPKLSSTLEETGLSSLGQDILLLVEEIYLQRRKTYREMDLFDRASWNVQSLFSSTGVILWAETKVLADLVQRAKVIAKFPQGSPLSPSSASSMFFSSASVKDQFGTSADATFTSSERPERIPGTRLLSERGRQQVLAGSRKCNPIDIVYLGDPMLSRVMSYEIPTLVNLTVAASRWLNHSLNFQKIHEEEEPDPVLRLIRQEEEYRNLRFRINLRFLADYRNCLFFLLTLFLWRIFG